MSDYRDGNSGRSQGGQEHSAPRAGRPRSEDPLAELARLIDEDPFADFDRPRQAQEKPSARDDEEDFPTSGDWTLDTSWPRYSPPAEDSGHSDADDDESHRAEAAHEPFEDEAVVSAQLDAAAEDAEAEHFRLSLEEHFRQIDTPDRPESEAAPEYAEDTVEPAEDTVEPAVVQAQEPSERQEYEEPSPVPAAEVAPMRGFDPVSAVAAHLFADEQARKNPRATPDGSAAGAERPADPSYVPAPEAHEIVRPAPLVGEQHRQAEHHRAPSEGISGQPALTDPEPDHDFSGWQNDEDVVHAETYADPVYQEDYHREQPQLAADDQAYDVESDFPPEIYEEPRRSRRGLLVISSLVGLVVVGGAVAMAYRGMSGDPSGEPPVIRADAAPTKIVAEADEPAAEEGQGKLVYERIGGASTQREERLVSREEPVFEVEGRDGPALPAESSGQTAATSDTASTASGRAEPRRVRTVVVRPDGTIIPPAEPARREDAARANAEDAPTGQARQAQPAGEERAGNENQVALGGPREPEFVPPSAPRPEPPQLRQGEQPRAVEQIQQAAQPLQADEPEPEEQTQQDEQPRATDEQRSGRPMQLVPRAGNNAASTTSRTETAALPSASAEQPEARPAGQPFPSGDYVVQVSSTRSEQEARAAASSLAQRHGSLLGDYRMGVERADLGDRGVFYRVAAGSMAERSDAIALCESLKANGLDCFVRRN